MSVAAEFRYRRRGLESRAQAVEQLDLLRVQGCSG
jgi:hypothetical protein